MNIAVIEGHTRIVGEKQGFRGLPIRDEIVNEKVLGPVHTMVSAWVPSPAELAALNAGANIHVRLYFPRPRHHIDVQKPRDGLRADTNEAAQQVLRRSRGRSDSDFDFRRVQSKNLPKRRRSKRRVVSRTAALT